MPAKIHKVPPEKLYDLAVETYDYDPATGKLLWKEPKENTGGRNRRTKKMVPGTEAGSTTWNHGEKAYRIVNLNGRSYSAARIVWLICTGSLPKNHIDHINGVRTDNRIENLRDVTVAENNKNRPRQRNNTTGHVGVYFLSQYSRYRAMVRIDGKLTCLGCFGTIDEAVEARKKALEKHGFHENHDREFIAS